MAGKSPAIEVSTPVWEIWIADLKKDKYPDPAEGWDRLNNGGEVERAYQAFKKDPKDAYFSYAQDGKNYYIEFDKAIEDDGTKNPTINKVPCLIATRCFRKKESASMIREQSAVEPKMTPNASS